MSTPDVEHVRNWLGSVAHGFSAMNAIARICDENDRLRAELENSYANYKKVCLNNEDLTAKLAATVPSHPSAVPEAVAKDAARYRWLRDGNDEKDTEATHIAVNMFGFEWDEAIDAAILAAADDEVGK